MKTKVSKQVLCILLLFSSFSTFVFAAKQKTDIPILYLFTKGNSKNHAYLIYKGEELITDLSCLKERNILEIRLDRNNKDSLLFSEKSETLYRVARLNFVTNEETVLFEFEFEAEMEKYINYRAFTETSFFYCNTRENNSKLHNLYEYNSTTKEITKLFVVDPGYIKNVQADGNYIYFYVDGSFDGPSGYYVIDRATGEVHENEINLGWTSAGGRYNNKLIREGSKVERYGNMEYWARDEKSCVILDMVTFKETKCTFKKRYEAMGGPLILLSEDYFLVPLCIQPVRDSLRNGLFGCNWTVCYTVFDINKNKTIFNGIVSETSEMRIIDALML